MSIDTIDVQTPAAEVPKTNRALRRSSTLFRVIWRWHFYAGLIVTPFLIIVALTGGIYTFAAEIVDFANRDILFVDSTGTRHMAYRSLMDRAEAAVPGGRATSINMLADPHRTSVVSVKPAKTDEDSERGGRRGRGIAVFINPYTGEVQGTSAGPRKLEEFFRVVLKLHRQLFVGTTGRIVVELATAWSIVLIASGIYLWWPRRKEKWKGVWVVRWTAKPYTLLRDLHSLMGIYLLPICLLVAMTGLFYTLVWGESFHFVTKQFFEQPVASEESPGERGRPEGEGEEPANIPPPRFTLQEAVVKARSLYPDRDITVSSPRGAADHYEVGSINDYARGTYGAMDSTGFKLHRDTGEVLEVSDLWDNERYWWHTWAYPLHVGSVIGMTSKVIWFAACMVLVALPITGVWMWWKRRPKGKSGFPRKPSFEVVPAWLWILLASSCVLLPVFGVSVLLIVIGDGIVRGTRRLLMVSS